MAFSCSADNVARTWHQTPQLMSLADVSLEGRRIENCRLIPHGSARARSVRNLVANWAGFAGHRFDPGQVHP
jgi:hypothetical protein